MMEFTGDQPGAADFRIRFRDVMQRANTERIRPAEGEIGPYLAISRQASSGGAQIARLVGERLGWTVLDREFVQVLADQLQVSEEMIKLMDETRSNWFSDTLLNLLNTRIVLQDSYVAMVGRVMALAAYREPVVLVGRAANLMLPRDKGVCVRVIAPEHRRLEELQRREGLDRDAAEEQLAEIDSGRRSFVDRHFDQDIDDPALYDLTVDSTRFGWTETAELLIGAVHSAGLVETG